MRPSLGVDVGGTKVLGVALDEAGTVVAEHRVPTPRGSAALVEDLFEVVALLRTEVGEVSAVGVGLPGLVDRDGVLRFAPNLPGVVELPVGRLAADAFGVPVVVDNDATCATWAEHRVGAARGVADVVLVALGTGIGGGVVLDGRLVRGANGFTGEIGHMVVDVDGIACVCGRRGCWERYASGAGLGWLAREAAEAGRGRRLVELAGGSADLVRGEHVTTAALEGDAEALAVLDRFADWFAVGLANLVHVLDVAMCVVGGGVIESGEVILEPIRRAFGGRLVAPDHRPGVAIVPAQLGEHAGAIGAALLAHGQPT